MGFNSGFKGLINALLTYFSSFCILGYLDPCSSPIDSQAMILTIKNRGDHNAAGTRHWCVSCKLPEKKKITTHVFLMSNIRHVLNVLCFLLGNSLASEFYMPTFRNTLSVPSSLAGMPIKMEQTECSETSVYEIQTPGNYQKGSIKILIKFTCTRG